MVSSLSESEALENFLTTDMDYFLQAISSDSSETIELIIIKLGMVTASDMVMHHVFIYIDLDLYSRSHGS